MVDALTVQVVELVAAAAEVKPARVLPTSRLLHDLKIDGDNAVELFDGVHTRFGTDLTHLYERWREYFGPEGIPLSAGLIVILAAVVAGIIAASVVALAGNVAATIIGFVAAITLIAAAIRIGRKLRLLKDPTPITVAQVVQAVEAGSWPKAAL